MPRKSYKKRLTHLEVLQLFDDGRYSVDPDTGIVYSGRTGKELHVSHGNCERSSGKRRRIRLYKTPRFRFMPVSHVIWIVMTRAAIPEGWEIHHDNGNESDDRWENLFCLHKSDHNKLHEKRRRITGGVIEEETIPF